MAVCNLQHHRQGQCKNFYISLRILVDLLYGCLECVIPEHPIVLLKYINSTSITLRSKLCALTENTQPTPCVRLEISSTTCLFFGYYYYVVYGLIMMDATCLLDTYSLLPVCKSSYYSFRNS